MEKAIKLINDYLMSREEELQGKNIIRVTELISCLKKAIIKRLYEIKDIEYKPNAIIGIALHDLMDKINQNKYERRLKNEIDGIIITGEYDYYDEEKNVMYDYKFLKDLGNYKNQYELQINIYAYLFFLNYKIKPNKLIIKTIDINNFDEDEKEIAIYPPEFILEYLKRRIADFKKGLNCLSELQKETNFCFFCETEIKNICENTNF